MRRLVSVLSVLIFLTTGAVAAVQAAAIDDFHDAAGLAYRHYRAAIFYLRTGNAMVASYELEQMVRRWDTVVERFAASPPGAYAADGTWRQTLHEIGERAAAGLQSAVEGKVEAARDHLTPIREILSQLRRRNGVTIYSDVVDEANRAFERLFRYRHRPPDFDDPEQVARLGEDLAATVKWYEKCRDSAPPGVRQSEEFNRLMDRNLYSLGRIRVAIKEKNRLNLINILRELHSSDQMLFLRFG